MLFSAAASSPAEEFHAKEPVLPKFRLGDVVLYRYDVYPFISDKVKAFLDYYDVPYKVVEVNISKRETWPANNKAPILMVDGDIMENKSDIIDNSSGIIDLLCRRIQSEAQIDSLSDNTFEENEWRSWVDDHLMHVLCSNIYRSTSEALEAYGYITTHGNFNFIERIVIKYAGAASMYILSKQLKKKHDITDERAALYDASEAWVDALKGRNFLGGWKPNLADLAVFGVLRSIRHLKSGEDMVEHTRIGGWYSRMEHAVGASSRVQA